MGVLEWLGAHLLGPVISLYRAITSRPRPEILIHELVPTGGGSSVDFRLVVQNVGTQPVRAMIAARIGETSADVITPIAELLANAPSTTVQIRVRRPELSDLVREFNHETTLYGETLTVTVADAAGKHRQSATWRELIYTPEENGVRHGIQQRVWRRARGEDTPADRRADWLWRIDHQHDGDG